ncbi:MAG: FAD-dependent oxidoreductase [Thermoguttaceae bacterium]
MLSRLFSFFVILLLASPTFSAFDPEKTVFLEAEGFAEKGGWCVDPQFYDSMGSMMLLAHGIGEPVGDAKTTAFFPKAGNYHIFVRTRNWVSPWTTEHAPGKFQMSVNGKKIDTIFGTEGNDWHWQKGGTVSIHDANKPVEISLHDLTGFDGRVDCICFSNDPDFTPPNDAAKEFGELSKMRRAALKLPDVAPEINGGPFDLVVVGGGIAGSCAAISAARLGLNVALVQDRPLVGGNNSSEVRVHLQGRINLPPYPNLGNLVAQMNHRREGNAQAAEVYEDEKKMNLIAAEKNLKVFFNTRAVGVEKSGDKITSVIGKNIETGIEHRFSAPLFADCTGDGVIGFLAGADWRMGRESKAETGEKEAPEVADKMTMGASVQWNTIDTGKPTTFPVLPWAIQFNEQSIKPMIQGDWDWETGLNFDQIYDFERIRDHGLRAAYGHWSYMKNQAKGEWAEKAKNRKFGWVAFIAGKRESRRLLGDVILQEQDVVGQKEWLDACVTTTWTIDLHYPEAHNAKFFPGEEFRTIAKHVGISPYAIPYRCLYSRNVPNLFLAGRNISVTHVALGTIRVQRTGGMMGEVVGMAASLCKKYDCLPRGVYEKYLEQLKSLMKEGVAPPPPGKSVKGPNPPKWLSEGGTNFAKNATISVSDSYKKANYPTTNINDGNASVASNENRWVSGDSEPEHWVLFSWKNPVEINAVRIISGQTGSGSPTTPIQDFVLQIAANDKWVELPNTAVRDNEECDLVVEFPAVATDELRLLITRTPGNLARIWEVEFYNIDQQKTKKK